MVEETFTTLTNNININYNGDFDRNSAKTLVKALNSQHQSSACGLGCLIHIDQKFVEIICAQYPFDRLLPCLDFSDEQLERIIERIRYK